MLDAFIIEEIRRRERERVRQERERPFVELPIPDSAERPPRRSDRKEPAKDDEEAPPQRGVVVIDLAV